MDKRFTLLLLIVLLSGCGAASRAEQLPTADIRLSSPEPVRAVLLAARPTVTPPAIIPSPQPAEPIAARVIPNGAPFDQYRAWMIEAQAAHPYSEPLQTMWDVMICESSGEASRVAGVYNGLFQFDSATWVGDWNPYRDQPILDPRAQIFAAAKAWNDGNQHWWGCYPG